MNIRMNGHSCERRVSPNIDIKNKENKPGIDVIVKPNTIGEVVSIPVVITAGNINDKVYNTIDIGAGSDVTVSAGCGIHNDSDDCSRHDGIHDFIIRENAKVKYIENHYGEGNGSGDNVLNPETRIELMENAIAELDMTQIEGVDSTIRFTKIILHDNAKIVVTERLMTSGNQRADSTIEVIIDGENASAQIISRSVAKGNSVQNFFMSLTGNAKCKGHIQCDSIIMDNAKVASTPKIYAANTDAELIHEATIGRIASDQLTKLMTIGITEEEAEDIIIKGFLD
ncbi:MAG: SufD family Fe-S cluster assembly protein [Peptostreptococcaceae bacterium]|nr:SufD family Fe-S cluster assembly protein [Peptostreptococcaceae bacterium]